MINILFVHYSILRLQFSHVGYFDDQVLLLLTTIFKCVKNLSWWHDVIVNICQRILKHCGCMYTFRKCKIVLTYFERNNRLLYSIKCEVFKLSIKIDGDDIMLTWLKLCLYALHLSCPFLNVYKMFISICTYMYPVVCFSANISNITKLLNSIPLTKFCITYSKNLN